METVYKNKVRTQGNSVKVSILIPVYNVENYLEQCLLSAVNQTLREIEIICIDDGSTDGSGRILDEYALKDSRIRVFHKENSGYGSSLNMALDVAQGEYVGILESDDFAEVDMCEFLYQIAVSNCLDCIKSNYYRYSDGGKTYHEALKYCQYNVIFAPDQNMEKFETRAINIWAGIYRRVFLKKNNIRFLCTPGASYQDLSFWFKVYVSAERSYFTQRAFINYRIDNNASSVKSKDKVFCVCDEIAECKQYLHRTGSDLNIFYPRMIKIMYSAYKWNANRIAPFYLRDFLGRVSQEMKDDQQSIYMDRSIFTELEWEEFQCMSEIPDVYIRMRYKQKEVEECENYKIYGQGILEYLCNGDIYIYGAGAVGEKIGQTLYRNGYRHNLIYLVTALDNRETEKEIKCISDPTLDKKRTVIIAAADIMVRSVMIQKAKEQGFERVLTVDDVIFGIL